MRQPILVWRILGFAVTGAFMIPLSSCDRSKKATTDPETTIQTTATDPLPENKGPEPTVPDSLGKALVEQTVFPEDIGRISAKTALVQIPNQPERTGILMKGDTTSYLVICEAPAELVGVRIAYQNSGRLSRTFAKRISSLPSGLSIFEFTNQATLPCYSPAEFKPGDTLYALRLKGDSSLSAEDVAAMTSEIQSLDVKLSTLRQAQFNGASRGGENRPTRGESNQKQLDRRQVETSSIERAKEQRDQMLRISKEIGDLSTRHAKINSLLKFPITKLTEVEVSRSLTMEEMETTNGRLDYSVLATSSNTILAIRVQNKWLNISDLLAASQNQIQHAQIELSGSHQSVTVKCKIAPIIPSAKSQFFMVAGTTYDLESKGTGTIEQRLAAVEPIPFKSINTELIASAPFTWDGNRTKLWLKVFNDQQPEKPILNEVILLDYNDSLSAHWGKPPSQLITIPASKPNTPSNLVSETETLDAKGEIIDIVAAGDGSILMVQTTSPPFWAALDAKTGHWMSVPWKATTDTLLATQAGNVYLVDSKTGIVEIWGMTSGKRKGMQILPLDTPINAVAAPLSSATQPVIVANEKGCHFIDPVKFELVPGGLNLATYSDTMEQERLQKSPIDPASRWLRASDDGSLYTVSGTFIQSGQTLLTVATLTVDSSSVVVETSNSRIFLASRGRVTSEIFPDHGGGKIGVMPTAMNAHFPDSTGQIDFIEKSRSKAIAVLQNPVALPKMPFVFRGSLKQDRGCYFDSSLHILLIPDDDKLHFLRIALPENEKQLSTFVFAGETVEIPIPVGTDHKFTSAKPGISQIGPTSIRWAPQTTTTEDLAYTLSLEWKGELGSKMRKIYDFNVIHPLDSPQAASPNAQKTQLLNRRLILSLGDSKIVGFAGSGTVALVNERSAFSAWNLLTGENLLHVKGTFKHVLGDADRIYTVDNNSLLTAYDIQTGKELLTGELGKKIESITTGMASTQNLLAVERDGTEGFLVEIRRETIKPTIIDLPRETREILFMSEFRSNASGSAFWSNSIAIFQDPKALTVRPFPREQRRFLLDGVPDASGKIVVGQDLILNLTKSQSKPEEIKTFCGLSYSPSAHLDLSGHYLLLSGHYSDSQQEVISVREINKPTIELIKIITPSGAKGAPPVLISNNNTLIFTQTIAKRSKSVIYDLNIPEIVKKFGH